MGAIYRAGESKTRPGVYRRFEKTGLNAVAGAIYGVFAIPVHADFGPLDKVMSFGKDEVNDLKAMYGTGGTVDAALALFDGGATKVHVYRLGTGGAVGTLKLGEVVTLSTKYPTADDYNVTVKTKLGDETTKQIIVYLGAERLETIEFAASTDEKEAIVAAVNTKSKYLTAKAESGTGAVTEVANSKFTGGSAPSVTTESYSAAFEAFESLKWNYIVVDTCETAVHALVSAYVARIYEDGSLGGAIIGEPTTVDFDTRCEHASAFNDEQIIYLGSGYRDNSGNDIDGYLAVAKQAGIIGSTESNRSITHIVVPGAAETLEVLKNSQYEKAIASGMVLLSPNDEGQVWFDSGVNTLITLNEDQDDGWRKIRRTATRFEMFDRIDRAVAPLIGQVNCDNIGIGDVVTAAQAVLDAMVSESKLYAGATFAEDASYKRGPDYAHFIINADDMDSLEKIYLRYQFRFRAE